MASTSHPSASSRSTSVDPMNPAPPVTITRTGSLRRRLGRWFGSVGFGAPDARPGGARPASRVASAPTIVWSEAMAPDPRIARSPTTESMVSASSETMAPSSTTDRSSRAPLPTVTPAPTTEPAIRAPAATIDAFAEQRGRFDARLGVDVRFALHPHPRFELARAGRGRATERAGQHVGVRLQVLLGRPDVDPVRVARHRVQAARLLEHAREGLPLDRDGQPLGDALAAPTARARTCPR